MMEWKWGLKEENKEEDRNDKEGSKDGLRESQKKRTLSSASC